MVFPGFPLSLPAIFLSPHPDFLFFTQTISLIIPGFLGNKPGAEGSRKGICMKSGLTKQKKTTNIWFDEVDLYTGSCYTLGKKQSVKSAFSGGSNMIKTKRLTIMPFDMKYLNDYFNGFNEEITRFQWPDPFASIDDAKNTLRDFMNEMEKGETLLFSILSKTDKFLGSVEIHGLTGECPELGVWVAASEQNKGYAYEALCAVLDYARSKYGKSQFFYEADIRNEASIKLLHKFEGSYEIIEQEPEILTTDSGKKDPGIVGPDMGLRIDHKTAPL